ncbi:hypothetical protein [Rhizobium binxianense]
MSQQSIHDRIMARESGPRISPEDNKVLRSSKRTIKTIAFTVAGLLLLGVAGFAAYRLPQVQQVFAQPVAATKTPDPSLADTPFLTHTKQAGLSACSNVFPVLGQLLTSGAKYNIVSEWNQQAPDQHPIQALVGLDYESQSYTGPAGGIVMAAPNGTDCEGAMVRVAPLPMACSNVPATLPQGSRIANTLGKVSVYTLAGNGGQALLVPSGQTCVVVSVAWARG